MVVSRSKKDKERLVSLSFLFYFTTKLETTTQDERGMNRLQRNALTFFLCRDVYSGSFYHFHRQ